MISGTLARLGAYAAAIAAAALAVWKVLADARARGRQDARIERMERREANRETRNAVDDRVRRDAGAAGRLRQDWQRD